MARSRETAKSLSIFDAVVLPDCVVPRLVPGSVKRAIVNDGGDSCCFEEPEQQPESLAARGGGHCDGFLTYLWSPAHLRLISYFFYKEE
jgi:hypothetical protein